MTIKKSHKYIRHLQAKRPSTYKRSDPTPRETKFLTGMFARYFALLLIGTNSLYTIYAILTPLTIFTTVKILSIFTTPILTNNFINMPGATIEIIPACVAGAAFYLLLILILSTPNIKPVTRIKTIITAIAILFTLNILRILTLIPLIKSAHFQTIHWIIWHFASTIFVVAIWLTVTKIYKIKSIPIYSDIKYLINSIKNPKRKKQNKKTSNHNPSRDSKKTLHPI